jgi:D-alanine-D-alanine ligase
MAGKKKKIAVLKGGPSPEHDVSLNTGKNVALNLDPEKYEAEEFTISRSGEWPIKPEELKKLFDLAFIAMHGPYGEDGTVQSILDSVGMPYTGSSAASSALGMNKWLSLRLFQDAGILIPPTIHLSRHEWFKDREGVAKKIRSMLGKPWVIKPNASGSSIGVRIEKDDKDLRPALEISLRDSKEIIVQEFIPGRELTCGVIDSGFPSSAFVLPPTEIIAAGAQFFDYRTKYDPATIEVTPAKLHDSQTQMVKRTALLAHKVLGCRSFSRSDFILTPKGKLYILETNTIPGMTENSLVPRAAKSIGMSFPKLLEIVIEGSLLK